MFFTWLIFIIQALITKVFLLNLDSDFLPTIVLGITSIFVLIDLSRRSLPKKIFIGIYISYLFRIALMVFDLYGRDIFILPNSGFDSEMYHNAAVSGIQTGNFGRGGIYSFTISIIYSLFGNERIISQYLNILLSINTILLVHKILEMYKIQPKIRHICILFIAFIPNYALLSSILLRESAIIFLITLSIFNFSKWIINNKPSSIIWAYIMGFFASSYHSGTIILILGYAIFMILYDTTSKQFVLNSKSIFYTVGLTVLFLSVYFYFGGLILNQFTNIDSFTAIFQNAENRVTGGSGYSINISTGNELVDFVINTPIRMFFYLLSPLPWQWRGLGDIIAFLFSSLFYSYIIYISYKEIKHKNTFQKQLIYFFYLIALLSIFTFSWGVSNSGTALRHRDKFITVFIILYSLVKNSKKERTKYSIFK